jgi:hypothetical protein
MFIKVYVPFMYEEDGFKDISKTSLEKTNSSLKRESLFEDEIIKTKIRNDRLVYDSGKSVPGLTEAQKRINIFVNKQLPNL